MAEWSNAAVLKTVELARVPGVRIPLSPPQRSKRTNHCLTSQGEMPEWSNGAVSKTVVLFRVPGVRIPFSPQKNSEALLRYFCFLRILECSHSKEFAENKN